MGWKAINGTDIEWSADSLIKGEISGDAIIESAPWLLTELKKYQTLNIRIKNGSGAKQARISIASVTPEGAFWKKNTINWEEEDHVVIELDPNAQEFREYTIDLSQLPNLEPMLQKIRIEPAVGVNKGNWEIEYINIHQKCNDYAHLFFNRFHVNWYSTVRNNFVQHTLYEVIRYADSESGYIKERDNYINTQLTARWSLPWVEGLSA